MFDPADQVPYAQIPYSVVDSPEHRALALEVARQSLVLLKNQNDLLPLDKDVLTSIAVIGPNADETLVLTGNYMGTPAEPVSVLAGIRALVSPGTEVNYARGCEILGGSTDGFDEAIQAAKKSQVAVLVVGLSQQLEGEQGQQEGNPPGVTSLGDRITLDLPPIQERLHQGHLCDRDAHHPGADQWQRDLHQLGGWAHSRHPGSLVPWSGRRHCHSRGALRADQPGRSAAGHLLQVGFRSARL